jgi:tRNA G10  N-methylase Trm11
MMIPQVANRLINLYGKNAATLFDPYCGTGTSLVEANLNGIDAYGTDINPMARLIAEAKTTIIELEILDLYLKLVSHNFLEGKHERTSPPRFHSIAISRFFKKPVKA